MTKLAIDMLTDPCPYCKARGFNRIWDCGTIMISGTIEQSEQCKQNERVRNPQ